MSEAMNRADVSLPSGVFAVELVLCCALAIMPKTIVIRHSRGSVVRFTRRLFSSGRIAALVVIIVAVKVEPTHSPPQLLQLPRRR